MTRRDAVRGLVFLLLSLLLSPPLLPSLVLELPSCDLASFISTSPSPSLSLPACFISSISKFRRFTSNSTPSSSWKAIRALLCVTTAASNIWIAWAETNLRRLSTYAVPRVLPSSPGGRVNGDFTLTLLAVSRSRETHCTRAGIKPQSVSADVPVGRETTDEVSDRTMSMNSSIRSSCSC